MFPFTWRRGSIFEEREIMEKTYSCGNDEFQHEEGSSGKWEKKDITYFIESFGTSMSKEDVRGGIAFAFSHYADTVDLTFTEVNDSDAADIVFGFKSGEHDVQMAHCVGKMPCTTIHFDDDQPWRYIQCESALNKGRWLREGMIDFLTVAMHQIGHALGLGHIGDDQTRHENANEDDVNIMDKIYTRPSSGKTDVYIWPRLRTGDVRAIKSLYQKNQKVEDFQEMKKDCQGYWNKHEYAIYNSLTGKYIVLQKVVENFLAAQAYCHEIGGFLVSIHSKEENQFITDFIRSKFSAGRRAYIGLVREDANSSWIWEDGTVLTYQNWNPTEPNNIGGFENSVEIANFEIVAGEDGGWNDIQNNQAKIAVCQVECPIEFKTQAFTEERQQEEEKKIFFTNILETYHLLYILLAILFILSVLFIFFLILNKRNSNKKRFYQNLIQT